MSETLLNIINYIHNKENYDQDSVKKNRFLKSGVNSFTQLNAVGISNGKLKKQSGVIYKSIAKTITDDDLVKLLTELENNFLNTNTFELQLLIIFVLENILKKNTNKEIKNLGFKIVSKWILSVDYWAVADHICINLCPYLNLMEHQEDIQKLSESNNFWPRRISFVMFVKYLKTNPDSIDFILKIITKIIQDKNYYVKKAIPWILRTIKQKYPGYIEQIKDIILNNINYLNKTQIKEIEIEL